MRESGPDFFIHFQFTARAQRLYGSGLKGALFLCFSREGTDWEVCPVAKKDWEALAAIVLFYVVIEALGVTCPILLLTGISCAGCGMSRAWLALLRLDLPGAAAFHPLFWLPVPTAALLLLRRRLPERFFRLSMAAVCILFITVYLARLLSPDDAVVVFQPERGLIMRLFSGVRKMLRS